MSNYQAIIFDLDGTAVPNRLGGMPSPRLIEAVAAHKGRLHLIAATGRSLAVALPVIEALELTDPCVVSGGTILYDPAARQTLRHRTLPRPALEAILRIAAEHPYDLYLRDERFNGEPAHTIADDIEIAYFTNVSISATPELVRQLHAIPGIVALIGPSWDADDNVLMITHKDATKEHAVSEVLARLGVPQEATIGIGDGDNDLHLFRSVGLKVAMGNASPKLKAAADLVAPSIFEDGLAHIIEKYAA